MQIVLASQSPYRRAQLEQFGLRPGRIAAGGGGADFGNESGIDRRGGVTPLTTNISEKICDVVVGKNVQRRHFEFPGPALYFDLAAEAVKDDPHQPFG